MGSGSMLLVPEYKPWIHSFLAGIISCQRDNDKRKVGQMFQCYVPEWQARISAVSLYVHLFYEGNTWFLLIKKNDNNKSNCQECWGESNTLVYLRCISTLVVFVFSSHLSFLKTTCVLFGWLFSKPFCHLVHIRWGTTVTVSHWLNWEDWELRGC